MSQEQHSIKAGKYQHLNEAERKVIERLRRNEVRPAEIARVLCRNRSTICRELNRGRVVQRKTVQSTSKRIEVPLFCETAVYFADVGQRECQQRREKTGAKCRIAECLPFVEYFEGKALSQQKWSPDATVGEAIANSRFENIPSTKTLYNWIDQGLCKVKNLDLLVKVRRRKRSCKPRKNKRIFGKSIEERPADVEKREKFGHWEGDGIVGAHQKGHLISLVERKWGYGFLFDVGDRDAVRITEVMEMLHKRFGTAFPLIFRSITFDNGTEFSGAGALGDDKLGIYYAHPFSSWKRATNENWNGIVRRFLPKGMPLDRLPVGLAERIANYINELPRKRLGYRSPADLFKREVFMLSST